VEVEVVLDKHIPQELEDLEAVGMEPQDLM